MPGFDRRGPEGEGPMTGRRMGKCAGNQPENPEQARGQGAGYGFFRRGPLMFRIRGRRSGRGFRMRQGSGQ